MRKVIIILFAIVVVSSCMFNEDDNCQPDSPQRLFPADSSFCMNDILLKWQCYDQEGDPLHYDVFLGTNEELSGSDIVSVGQVDTVFYPQELIFGATHYWKIKAYDSKNSVTGDTWSFIYSDTDILNMPDFNPHGGHSSSAQSVTISCSIPDAVIHYTLDNSTPDTNSVIYTEPVYIAADVTLKARAFKDQWVPSPVYSNTYFIEYPDDMILVEGGTFDNRTSNITLSSYYLGQFEVTQEEYEEVMGYDPSHFSGNTKPVEMVTWFDAIEYCNRRSIMEGYEPCYTYSSYGTNPDNWPEDWDSDDYNHIRVLCNWYTADGYRLPTEAEWEFAARGGNYDVYSTYSGGNSPYDVGWFEYNNIYGTQPVGGLLPNELGFYDLSGNVYEWVWDMYESYPEEDQTNPHGAENDSRRVLRGGSYLRWPTSVFERNRSLPINHRYEYGFRVGRTAN